jgi:hypothetical protein
MHTADHPQDASANKEERGNSVGELDEHLLLLL